MAYSLGIDVGTSKVAAALVDVDTGEAAELVHEPTRAVVATVPGRAEQDTEKIRAAIEISLAKLSAEGRAAVDVIGITGQMHGVVFWRAADKRASHLVSWQDRRCSEDGFLQDLRKRIEDHSIQDGYGCATIAWFASRNRSALDSFDCAGTVHDYLAAILCDSKSAVTDTTSAASWGMFNLWSENWDYEKTDEAGIPRSLLPRVAACGAPAGRLAAAPARQLGLPEGIPLVAPIGDNQASLLATLSTPRDEIALTLGTGGQLSVIIPRDQENCRHLPASVELRPYPGKQFAAVAAALCGGKSFDWLADTVDAWISALGGRPFERDQLFDRLNELGLESFENNLAVCSSFMGERHDPTRRGSICNIDLQNCTLGNVASSLACDIVANLRDMMPTKFLSGRKRVVGSGNGLRRLSLMRRAVEHVFQLPLELPDSKEEAAVGAALHALGSLR